MKNRVLDRERRELEQRLEEEKHTPEVCFVEQAMRELDTRLSNTVESGCTDIGAKLSDVFGALNLPPIVDNEENVVDTEFVPCIPEAVEDHGVQQVSNAEPLRASSSFCLNLACYLYVTIFSCRNPWWERHASGVGGMKVLGMTPWELVEVTMI